MANLLASFQAGYIADLVCAAILIICAFAGLKKGFVKSFFGRERGDEAGKAFDKAFFEARESAAE